MARRRFRALACSVLVAVALSGCTSDEPDAPDASESPLESGGATASTAAVSGNTCPQVLDTSKADFYPIQPSFSAGYSVTAQSLNSATQDWAYVIKGEFPYSNWMAWYLYTTKGVPLFKLSDTDIKPDEGSTNPFVPGNPVLAADRSYHVYLMPHDTPESVIDSMESEGKNVVAMPDQKQTPGVSIVSRSYWSFSNDGLGNYDRFGYGGPTNTPVPTISAFLTDKSSGELTQTPVSDCSSQSQLPKKLWYDAATNSPIVTFEDAPYPSTQELRDIPHLLLQTGSMGGGFGSEFPPEPDPTVVEFYRDVADHAPYADVQSAPPAGSPPDACGGYVFANLPNDVVSLVHIPKVPSFPDYRGATEQTLNNTDQFNVAFYSVVVYGATKQVGTLGSVDNSQLGNRQIKVNKDGSATFVFWPQSATQQQVEQISDVVKANGWNLLRSGVQTAAAPNLVVIREKGQNDNWKNALSANSVTDGAPCPQSKHPNKPLPQDPPSAQVTQFNGMGLTAPQGQNCSIGAFLTGRCLEDLQAQLKSDGAKWSARGGWPSQLGG
jgi:hypothetical protein